MILKNLHDVGNGRSLLTDGDVDAEKSLGVVRVGVIEGRLLVDDGINSDGSLASLSISNNELSLASTNGDLFYNLLIKDSSGANCLLLYK